MGNTHSMNNMSMLDQKRYQAEFLRYSQIPYESQYHQQQQSIHASNMNLHQFNKYKEQLANPVKVLPDAKFEQKLRNTNNGAILHSGGTISGRKDSDVSCRAIYEAVNGTQPVNLLSVRPTSLKEHFRDAKHIPE